MLIAFLLTADILRPIVVGFFFNYVVKTAAGCCLPILNKADNQTNIFINLNPWADGKRENNDVNG